MKMNSLYAFVFRGLLTEEALDHTSSKRRQALGPTLDSDLAKRLPFDYLDQNRITTARRMATVYTAIAAFENTVREFIVKRLLEEVGEEWWSQNVPEGVRKRAESRQQIETQVRWHTPRGDSPINYTEFGDLSSIVGTPANWPLFESHLNSLEWAKQIFRTLEYSRNVIMHSGELSVEDVERVASAMRDWIKQVGA